MKKIQDLSVFSMILCVLNGYFFHHGEHRDHRDNKG